MNKTFIFRLNDEQLKNIRRLINHDPEKYFSVSHFIRVAIVKELRGKENENNVYENGSKNSKGKGFYGR